MGKGLVCYISMGGGLFRGFRGTDCELEMKDFPKDFVGIYSNVPLFLDFGILKKILLTYSLIMWLIYNFYNII